MTLQACAQYRTEKEQSNGSGHKARCHERDPVRISKFREAFRQPAGTASGVSKGFSFSRILGTSEQFAIDVLHILADIVAPAVCLADVWNVGKLWLYL